MKKKLYVLCMAASLMLAVLGATAQNFYQDQNVIQGYTWDGNCNKIQVYVDFSSTVDLPLEVKINAIDPTVPISDPKYMEMLVSTQSTQTLSSRERVTLETNGNLPSGKPYTVKIFTKQPGESEFTLALEQPEVYASNNGCLSTGLPAINAEDIKVSVTTSKTVHIALPAYQGTEVRITNMLGQAVASAKPDSETLTVSPSSGFANGMYIVSIAKDGKIVRTERVVIN